MKRLNLTLTAGVVAVAMGALAPAHAQNTAKPAQATAPDLSSLHGFDFEVGEWRVHHRIKRPNDPKWLEFDGTCTNRSLMDGFANIEEHRFDRPVGVTYGVAMRAYDAKTGEWAIWWVDSRVPHGPVDPPVKGRFKNGVGTFYSDDVVDGKPRRTRFIWSHITATSARWEQAYSLDGGKTWEPNWIMELQRTRKTPR